MSVLTSSSMPVRDNFFSREGFPSGEKYRLLIHSLVLPNFNFGPSIDPANQGFPSSSVLPVLLQNGQVTDFHHLIPRRKFP